MAKSSEKYPRLHGIVRGEVLFVTVAEGSGEKGDAIHEVTYVCQVIDGYYRLIGELYDGALMQKIKYRDGLRGDSMTRQEAEAQIMEHFKEIIKIAQAYDKDTNYLSLAAFAASGYLSVTNGKDEGDKRLNCHYFDYKNGNLFSN